MVNTPFIAGDAAANIHTVRKHAAENRGVDLLLFAENNLFGGFWKDYDADETIYHHDEFGWVSSVGYGDNNDWGMVEYTPTADGEMNAVDFWATGGPTLYGIYIYDDFSGGTRSNILGTAPAGNIPDVW